MASPRLIGLSISILAASLASCVPINNGGNATCGTQVTDPNEVLAGCLIDDHGRAAIEAQVWALSNGPSHLAKRSASLGGALSDSDLAANGTLVYTDQSGRYAFSNLPKGNYDLLFQSGPTMSALHPNVDVTSGYRWLNKDFLSARGYIFGKLVEKSTGAPIDSAYCSVPGKPFGDSTDSGEFSWSMPEGRYTIVCSHSPFKDAKAETVQVVSGKDTHVTLEMSSVVETDSAFTPAYITATYDTARGVVHLSWPPISFRGFYSYIVKRIDPATFLLDSVVYTPTEPFQDDYVYKSRADTAKKRLYYSLSCVKTNTRTTEWVNTFIDVVRPPSGVGADIEMGLAGGDSVVNVGDTVRVWANYANKFRINTRLDWIVQKPEDDTFSWKNVDSLVRGIEALSGTDTLVYPVTNPGKVKIILTLTDERGISNTSTLRFDVASPTPAQP